MEKFREPLEKEISPYELIALMGVDNSLHLQKRIEAIFSAVPMEDNLVMESFGIVKDDRMVYISVLALRVDEAIYLSKAIICDEEICDSALDLYNNLTKAIGKPKQVDESTQQKIKQTYEAAIHDYSQGTT